MTNHRLRLALTIAWLAVATIADPSTAQSIQLTTTNSPTWHRPNANGASISDTVVRYDAFAFHVSITDIYTLTATPQSVAFDVMEFLYGGTFDPVSPLTGFLAAEDDGGDGDGESLSRLLASGTQYYAVTTGYAASDAGAYTLSFAGAGMAIAGAPPPMFVSNVNGDTTDAPTWDRPNVAGGALSGLIVPYQMFAFQVSASDTYAFTTTPQSGTFDVMQFLYEESFAPATPLEGYLAGNDAQISGGAEQSQFALITGATYYAVTTGFDGADFGAYGISITGPGLVNIVEPPFLAGDFNEDQSVDADDLVAWQSGFGVAVHATHMQGDANSDQDVDGDDFLVWQRQLGGSTTPAVSANAPVPEPTTLWLFIMVSAGLHRLSGRKCQILISQ